MTIIHIALSILAAGMIGYLLICHAHLISSLERYGLGLIGGGFIMTIGPVISEHSPFDLWAGGIVRLGMMLCIWGWLQRVPTAR